MRERPILFSGPMVRAILDGRKSQTRRVIKPQPTRGHAGIIRRLLKCKIGEVGDILWVKEGLRKRDTGNPPATITYPADDSPVIGNSAPGISLAPQHYGRATWQWKGKHLPSIFMPRWASRITLEITDVRIERVQDISEEDAKAEGVSPCGEHQALCPGRCYGNEFAVLWNSINAKRGYGWDVNPFVWVIEFRRIP